MIEEVATQFSAATFNLKRAFKAIILTEFYRADGLATVVLQPQRQAELDDIGVVRLLAPEQLELKIAAIFGKPWGQLNDHLKILYGGIDSQTVTERNADPSGAMGAIQRIMANDVPCEPVVRDFRMEPGQRLLFPQIEPDVLPGDELSNQKLRRAMVSLHQRLLGNEYPPDHPEIDRTFQLFEGIIADSKKREGLTPNENWFCGGRNDFQTEDRLYTQRAWRGVVTYLLRQHEFLYE